MCADEDYLYTYNANNKIYIYDLTVGDEAQALVKALVVPNSPS